MYLKKEMKTHQALLVLLTIFSFALAWQTSYAKGEIADESLYQLDSEWKNQDGKAVSLREFAKEPVILAMAYTSCQYACPMILSNMQAIENKLKGATKKRTKFLLVSFDTQRDTPEVLKAYMQKRKLDPARWQFLTGGEQAVREIAATLNISYSKLDNGEFAHSNVITLLDEKGIVRHQLMNLNTDPTELLKELEKVVK